MSDVTTLPLVTGSYTLDAAHSGVHFQVRHLGLSTVRGRFNTFDASLTIGPSLDDVVVEATIDLASVDTNQPDRDAHLRSTDFFHADDHPEIHFRSTSTRQTAGDEYELCGDLTINGITRPVGLAVTFNGTEVHPGTGNTQVGFDAKTEIKRSEFGIDFNMPLGVDKLALSEKIKVELDLQFVAPAG